MGHGGFVVQVGPIVRSGLELRRFAAALRGAELLLWLFPGLRFACPGLLSVHPYGMQDTG